MQRRDFLKNACTLCIGTAILGISLDATAKKQKPLKLPIVDGKIFLPLAEFTTLNTSQIIIRNKNLDADILVVKNETDFHALEMLCSHQRIPLSFQNQKLICSAHGSQFDLQGNVLQEPAIHSLHKLQTAIIDLQTLSITI
jgi:Rieske Fe-S protein